MKIFKGKDYFKQQNDKFINHYLIVDKYIYLSAQQNVNEKSLYGWELVTLRGPMFRFEIKVDLDREPKDVNEIRPLVDEMINTMVELKKVEFEKTYRTVSVEYAQNLGFANVDDTLYQKVVDDVCIYAYEHSKNCVSSPTFSDKHLLPDIEIALGNWLNLEKYEDEEKKIIDAVYRLKGVRDEIFV